MEILPRWKILHFFLPNLKLKFTRIIILKGAQNGGLQIYYALFTVHAIFSTDIADRKNSGGKQ